MSAKHLGYSRFLCTIWFVSCALAFLPLPAGQNFVSCHLAACAFRALITGTLVVFTVQRIHWAACLLGLFAFGQAYGCFIIPSPYSEICASFQILLGLAAFAGIKRPVSWMPLTLGEWLFLTNPLALSAAAVLLVVVLM